MMVPWIVCGYLALAAIFYMVLAATATDISVPARVRHPKRQWTHKAVGGSLLRRIRRN